jgi:hypothetical protein
MIHLKYFLHHLNINKYYFKYFLYKLDLTQEHEKKEILFQKERTQHDQLNNLYQSTLEMLVEKKEQVEQIQMLYDTVESERNELQTTVARLIDEGNFFSFFPVRHTFFKIFINSYYFFPSI